MTRTEIIQRAAATLRDGRIDLSQGSLFGGSSGIGSQGRLFSPAASDSTPAEKPAGHWVTIHGHPVFIGQGRSVGEALREHFKNSGKPITHEHVAGAVRQIKLQGGRAIVEPADLQAAPPAAKPVPVAPLASSTAVASDAGGKNAPAPVTPGRRVVETVGPNPLDPTKKIGDFVRTHDSVDATMPHIMSGLRLHEPTVRARLEAGQPFSVTGRTYQLEGVPHPREAKLAEMTANGFTHEGTAKGKHYLRTPDGSTIMQIEGDAALMRRTVSAQDWDKEPKPRGFEPAAPPAKDLAAEPPADRSAGVVDPNKQLGMFAKDATGNPVEVGEKIGQGSLFGNTTKPPAPAPAMKTDDQKLHEKFDQTATPNMFDGSPAAVGRAAAGKFRRPEPIDETDHANDAGLPDAAGERDLQDDLTPRAKADKNAENDPDYVYARASDIRNAGEDLKGSARHKVGAFKSLQEAEADGTAEASVTRENLLRSHPHALMANITPANALSSLAAHLALQAFPADPSKFRGRDRHTPELRRQQYFDAYQHLKGVAEKVATEEHDPFKALARIHEAVQGKIKELRQQNGSGYMDQVTAPDSLNPIANALVDTLKRTVSRGPSMRYKANTVASKLQDFAVRLHKAHGDPTPDVLEKAVGHVRDIIEGDSFNKTFDTVQSGRKGFDPTELYVHDRATRKGGRSIDTGSAAKGTDFITRQLGMRGLQWGNSVSDDERLHHLAKASEAMGDLADVTGLPDHAMSLGNTLGFAIGARGKGNALAHYEPDNKVINLTRKKGVGSLAHEWGHALDHYVTGGGTIKGMQPRADFMSERPGGRRLVMDGTGNIKMENGRPVTINPMSDRVHAAMKDLQRAMKSSGFESRLNAVADNMVKTGQLSEGRRKYWTSDVEKFARVFEKHIEHKLKSEGRENTYLTGSKNHGLMPTAEESAAIAPHVDRLMAAVKTKHFAGEARTNLSAWRSTGTLARVTAAAIAAGRGEKPVVTLSAVGDVLYLSAACGLRDAVTFGQGLPDKINGLPMHYRWCDAAYAGDWAHPKTGRAVPINEKRIDAWVDNIKLSRKRGVNLPVCKDHQETADNSVGEIFDARRTGGRLDLLLGFKGDDALKVGQRNYLSIGIDGNFKDSKKNAYGEAIRHVAVTPVPVIHGQVGFLAN